MAISLRQLKYFLVLAQELHYGRAAEKLNISQPPLSASIRQLEESLGAQLLERSTKGTRLTSAGVAYSKRIESVLAQLDAAGDALSQMTIEAEESIVVGFLPSMMFRNIAPLFSLFTAEHPNISLSIDELNSSRQISAIESHRVDIGFIHAMPLPEGFDKLTLERERFVCCLPRGHRLVTRSRVSINELSGEKILICSRAESNYYHDHIAALLRSEGLEPYLQYRIQHWFTILMLVEQGFGVSIVPQSLMRSSYTSNNLVFIELEQINAHHELQLAWRTADQLIAQSPVNKFIRLAKKHYLKLSN